MKVLIVKMSSLGDVIHALPALSDAKKAIPEITFHWVIEERFATIAHWHPAVSKVIPIALRRWRKAWLAKTTRAEMRAFKEELRRESYDAVVDLQGLLKSAWVTRLVKAERFGYDRKSIREPLASFFYHKKFAVSRKQHAVDRNRQLLCQALYYPFRDVMPDYGIPRQHYSDETLSKDRYLLCFHGTTWANKHWPESYWIALVQRVTAQGLQVKLGWGSEVEKARAERIASVCRHAVVLERLDLEGLGLVIANAVAVVSVDTGLGHLAAAFDVPTLALYGPTDPVKSGILGEQQFNLSADFPCAPCLKRQCAYRKPASEWPACFTTVSPDRVWAALERMV